MAKYDYYITGTIGVEYDWWTGQRGTTAEMVRNFLQTHKDEELTIAVSSFGGYICDGITIAEEIKAHGKCNMVIIGMTASSATVLCMKAKSVKIAKGSLMLIHNSSQMLDVWTTANKHGIDELMASLKKERDDLDTIDKAIASFYSGRNGKTIEENMAKMDEEKWMSAQEAVDFGIVDGILDDEDTGKQAKAARNAYASVTGLAEHYGLPRFSSEDNEKGGVLRRLKEEFKSFIGKGDSILNSVEEIAQTINTQQTMKKLVLNLVCGLLALESITVNDKSEVNLSEEQLRKIEDHLKELNGQIDALKSEKKTAIEEKDAAVAAKSDAEQELADLQDEFDDFKGQAGDNSPSRPASSSQAHDPANAKDMLNDIKDLL